MALSLLKPLSVSAKVIGSEVKVPSLTGALFNRDETLEPGIHVHWALPDNLTRAKLLPKGGKDVALFPGVPDLWLVIRFNPGPPISQISAKRSWRAWVVDSVAQTAVDLNAWSAPVGRDPKLIHTVAGMLPNAADLGYPARGIWNDEQGPFDPAVAAYYPSSRKRFGFYDKVADIGPDGNVSYVVIGWYADRGFDPLYTAKDKLGLLNEWRVAHHIRANAYVELSTASPGLQSRATRPRFEPRSIGVREIQLAAGKEIDFMRASVKGGTPEMMFKKTETMQANFPVAQGAEQVSNGMIATYLGPTETLLHGSVVEVPLKGGNTIPAAITTETIRLYPSVRRAMAELAAMNVANQNQVDAVEMMLDDLESMKSSTGGVLDMPGMAHAATFQSVPGKSKWYARMEIHPKNRPWQIANAFDVQMTNLSPYLKVTGHWPEMQIRSKSVALEWMSAAYADNVVAEPAPAQPQQPTDGELQMWRESVRAAFNATAVAAQGEEKTIEPNLLQVTDRRQGDAQPVLVGKVAGRGGSDGAGWWIDVQDDKALNELYRCVEGGKVIMPHLGNLFEVPGQRWNRPWSPQLVLFGTGRSYKFGFDGRFRADGYLKTRLSGETSSSLTVGSLATVRGKDIMEKPDELFSKPGIPSEARALISEALLLDTESTGIMANLASGRRRARSLAEGAQKQMRSAVRGLWLSRDAKTVAAKNPNLSAIVVGGTFPSDVAISPWQEPRDPLFVDVSYSHPHSSLAQDWSIDQDCVEMKAKGPEGTVPAAGQVEVLGERTKVTPSVVKVLESAFVTKKSLDVARHLVLAQKPPKGVTADTFKQLDVISAPLTALDSTLVDRNYRERTGALRINQLELVDMYGLTRPWNSGIDPASPEGSPALTFWTEIAPRLPYWARLHFRLQQANNFNEEANPLAHPVCGILVPDFLEHALEVFDGDGLAIGQLSTDRPRFGGGPGSAAASLQVTFALHPWVAAKLNLPPNSLDGIPNATLRSLVESLLAQGAEMPAEAGESEWFETGLSAMLRTIDTVRATLDPSKKTDDKRVKLLGEPILVLAARLSYEGTSSTNPSELAKDPPLLTEPPAMPVLTVRIGDSTRPDDGVLGCFNAGNTPAEGRFAPVTKEAAEKAILNGLAMGVPFFAKNGLDVKHPFVKDQESLFQIQANQNKNIVILADPRGGLYATCGPLPRKKITMPREFIAASLRNLEPTFRVGPIFTTTAMGTVKALVPPPQIEGLSVEYVYRQPGENGGPETFPEVPVPPTPPLGELPKDRAVLTDGWMRVFKPEEE
jgi:hypothetical protein